MFIIDLFFQAYKTHTDLTTFHLVLDPLIHSYQERLKGDRQNKVKPGTLQVDEADFLSKVVMHEMVPKQSSQQLLELLSTLYIGRPSIASQLLPALTYLATKHADSQRTVSFISNILVTKALAQIIHFKQEAEQTRSRNEAKSQRQS